MATWRVVAPPSVVGRRDQPERRLVVERPRPRWCRRKSPRRSRSGRPTRRRGRQFGHLAMRGAAASCRAEDADRARAAVVGPLVGPDHDGAPSIATEKPKRSSSSSVEAVSLATWPRGAAVARAEDVDRACGASVPGGPGHDGVTVDRQGEAEVIARRGVAGHELRELRVVGCQPPLPGDHQRARRRSHRAGRRERVVCGVGRREELGEWLLRQPRRPGAGRQRRQRAQHEDPRAGAGRDHPRAAAAPPSRAAVRVWVVHCCPLASSTPPLSLLSSRARKKRGDAAGTGTYASPEPRGQ